MSESSAGPRGHQSGAHRAAQVGLVAGLCAVVVSGLLPWVAPARPGTAVQAEGFLPGFGKAVAGHLGLSYLDVHRAVPVMLLVTFGFSGGAIIASLLAVIALFRSSGGVHVVGAVLAAVDVVACGAAVVPSHADLVPGIGPVAGAFGFFVLAICQAVLAWGEPGARAGRRLRP
ncbi:hypothetical protein ACIHFD_35705 [Nonomuraea sp. NPDC051941]|uniref:hypothetical protein n=1 Tax=Nonomuraea sp. NPDC051941 TaxID=3364373 RepID=UPI0037CC648E